jgi:HD-like signal output (HDOD) protein
MTPSIQRSQSAADLRAVAVASLIKSSQELSVLPSTSARILQLANDPKADMGKLDALVRTDVALAGRILALANSASFRTPGGSQIGSIPKAVMRIGTRALSALVLSVSMSARVMRVPGFKGKAEALTAHAARAGVATREIARHLRLDPEGGFLIGLLHDVGRFVALEAYATASPETRKSLLLAPEGIDALLDSVQSEIGAFTLRRWGLSESLVSAIEHCESIPPRLENDPLVLLAHVGHHLANQISSEGGGPRTDIRTLAVTYRLGLDPPGIEALLERLPGLAEELRAAITHK